jgi:hypothetical protein
VHVAQRPAGASSSAAGPSTVTVNESRGRWSPSPSALMNASLRVQTVKKPRRLRTASHSAAVKLARAIAG